MSTRSGKRIHTSLLEDTANKVQEPAVKSERKTRSKRVKENTDELSVSIFKNKKRNNYVSYPTDDELLGDTETKKEGETKQNRGLRKNALKEHNPVENSDQLETQIEEKHLIRKSRRGKRVDNAEEIENHENVLTEIAELPKSKKNKKKKKEEAVIDNSEEAPAKKSKKKKKKGKRSSSMIVEDIPLNGNPKTGSFNRSNMSVDSFHSAADSSFKNENIDTVQVNKVNETFEKTEEGNKPSKTTRKNSKKNIHIHTTDKNDVSINMSLEKIYENKNNNKSTNKKGNLSSEVTALDQCFVSVTRDNLEKGLENILNVSNMSNAQVKRRNSNTRGATFDKTNILTDVGLEKDMESNSEVCNMSTRQLKKRKSNVKEMNEISLPEKMSEDVNDPTHNDTFDKRLMRRSSVVKDVTFDKSNASIVKEVVDNNADIDLNISNMSNKYLKTRRSMVKDTTFDKSNVSITKEDVEMDLNVSKTLSKARKSILKDSTFNKSNGSIANGNNIEKYTEPDLNVSSISNKQLKRRNSNVKNSTFDKQDSVLNTTFEKEIEKDKESVKDWTFNKSNNKHTDATNEIDLKLDTPTSNGKEKISSVNTTYDKTDKADTTFEKDISTSFDAFKKGAMTRKSSIRDATFDKSELSMANLTKDDFEKDKDITSSTATKRRSIRRTFDKNDAIAKNVVNTTYEKAATENELRTKSPRLSISKIPDIQTVLNTTFEKDNAEDGKENFISSSKSSLISSDNSSVADKSDISRISITSDDTSEHIENILNTTPLLVESSIDESQVSITKPVSPKPQTPLKREGTWTKDVPEVLTEIEAGTPTKRKSIPTAGCTPYHVTKSSQKKSMFNVTRSLEKGVRATIDQAPRLTRVIFCSPVDNPVIFTQEKRKVIKSNLKGSNKSFVFEETSIARPARKRSYTQNDADDTRVKRTRLTEDLKQSVDRLSRPRTASATGKLAVVTPKKPVTPSKPRSEGKPSRTKLPNFAAMHQKQFDKMESLDECQERRAKRAKQLLTPTAPPGLLERISPKNNTDSPKGKELAKPKEKTDTPTKKLPTLESLRSGFTRFGFKLNLDVNPFSIPSKTAEKPKEKPVEKPNGILPRQGVLPSLAGATSVRREVAKLTVMREKSFTDRRIVKRNENRTVIKGVRTNRRFELQMKMRNIE